LGVEGDARIREVDGMDALRGGSAEADDGDNNGESEQHHCGDGSLALAWECKREYDGCVMSQFSSVVSMMADHAER